MQEEAPQHKRLKVAIVGAGLVGSLSACYFAKRGHEVHLYEYREDIRKSQHIRGRTINLSMSTRGRKALREIGLEEHIIHDHGIPMRGRMIHKVDGTLQEILYDPKGNQCIYSVSRRYLNEILLSATEKYPQVSLHFQHKLVTGSLEEGHLTFQRKNCGKTAEFHADLVVGADGAFSTVRRLLMKQPLFDFSQTYIEHGYLELCMPPNGNGDFVMHPNYLHIWPRGTFMMIAMPNQDRSWTVTLFMPFTVFKQLNTPENLLEFFSREFPDSIALIGEKRLIADFLSSKPSPLVSIKCKPYHFKDKAVIIGDAAHAMVPFYGQGMNAGFEDCYILDKIMVQHNYALAVVLEEFSKARSRDAHAICDLAMYNYIEMRSLVNKRSFLMRKKLDNLIFSLLPKYWLPLYFSVAFSSLGYNQCLQNKKWQDKVMENVIQMLVFAVILASVVVLYNIQKII